jgi:hypothetical protein
MNAEIGACGFFLGREQTRILKIHSSLLFSKGKNNSVRAGTEGTSVPREIFTIAIFWKNCNFRKIEVLNFFSKKFLMKTPSKKAPKDVFMFPIYWPNFKAAS